MLLNKKLDDVMWNCRSEASGKCSSQWIMKIWLGAVKNLLELCLQPNLMADDLKECQLAGRHRQHSLLMDVK
jgi:hypothetical protein